ncbi:MAG TPA: hypothetical protein VF381_11805, partial [Thermoanaerobaculia bacterium]
FALLDRNGIVAAPATDGGVNLIGLSAPAHELLASIEIGVRCIDAFATAALLDAVTDIDSPRDVSRAARELAWAMYFETKAAFSEYLVLVTGFEVRPTSSRAPPAV